MRVVYNIKDGENQSSTVKLDVKSVQIQEVKKLMGIRGILDLITKKGLPMVGYEVINDLMFLYHWCIDRLPENCQEFVQFISQEFPIIIDVHVFMLILVYCCRIS